MREDLVEFTESNVIDLQTDDEGALEFAPVETSLQPMLEDDESGGEQ